MSGDIAATGLLPAAITELLELGAPFRGKQVFRWICKGASSFADMSDLPAETRSRLSSRSLFSTKVSQRLDAEDGSSKLKIELDDASAIESVLLCDAEGRLTACLSTQVGCAMACVFCKTGTLGFRRNLRPDEIVEQYLHLQRIHGKPSNIVFMGMGEPLLNLDSVRAAIAVLSHPDGLNISHRKITISTCGIVPGIRSLADQGPHVRLAVSLTAATDDLRGELMPVNRSWDLSELKEALLYYQEKTGDRITLEAAIMGGRNSDRQSAQAMAAWIRPLKAQVNVIAWNPIPGMPYREPSRDEMEAFVDELASRGVNVERRAKRGRGVSGACGQLGDTLGAGKPTSP